MKKSVKKKENIFDRKINLTIDKRLDNLDLKSMVPEEFLAETNRQLKKIKVWPK